MIDTHIYYPTNNPDVKYYRSMCGNGSKKIFDILFSKYNINIFVEIGTFTGGGIKYLLGKKENIFIISIDTWDNQLLIDILKKDKQLESNPYHIFEIINELETYSIYDAFLTNIWENKDKILPLKMDSINGLEKIKELNITPDVIYIDSSHQYENTKNELDVANNLFPNSIIYGDDYSETYDGVIRAVDEFIKKHNYTLETYENGYLIIK
jgi:hypothetical protein